MSNQSYLTPKDYVENRKKNLAVKVGDIEKELNKLILLIRSKYDFVFDHTKVNNLELEIFRLINVLTTIFLDVKNEKYLIKYNDESEDIKNFVKNHIDEKTDFLMNKLINVKQENNIRNKITELLTSQVVSPPTINNLYDYRINYNYQPPRNACNLHTDNQYRISNIILLINQLTAITHDVNTEYIVKSKPKNIPKPTLVTKLTNFVTNTFGSNIKISDVHKSYLIFGLLMMILILLIF